MSTADRWRLVLGRFAEDTLPLDDGDRRLDDALDFLYGREYSDRGLRGEGGAMGGQGDQRSAGLEGSQPSVVDWLGDVRELFPQETAEIVVGHALERYGLTELVTDPEVLERLEPNETLLRTLLTLRSALPNAVLPAARRIIAAVVEELRRRLEMDLRPALSGRLSRQRHSPIPIAANFDASGTIRRNLKHYDPEHHRLVIAEPRFFERNSRRAPWDVIICVDQSGSMVSSVIHSAVMAGILAGLPSYNVKLVAFDTNIVDLTDRVEDPVEVLMSVQLGGGTLIAQAMRYCQGLVTNPSRTVLVLVTDFMEGGPEAELVRVTRELAEQRVRLIGLAALDDQAIPSYDVHMAERLADVGMKIAALTPHQLAQWLVEVTS